MPDATSDFYHDDTKQFREALSYTESHRGFLARLIEKDYFCSLVLQDFLPLFQLGLTFKGGTSSSKVHTDFYRLSEDLDFVIHVADGATRSLRRQLIGPVKQHFTSLSARLPFFRVIEPLNTKTKSKHYEARLLYPSYITGQDDVIKVDISLREPILDATENGSARTLLIDPTRTQPAIPAVPVRTLSTRETYAEKIRAAVSRDQPAIRDFFDIEYAIRSGLLTLEDPTLLEMTVRKLRASDASVDIADERLASLRQQLLSQLRPVLRQADFAEFDLDSTFGVLRQFCARLDQWS